MLAMMVFSFLVINLQEHINQLSDKQVVFLVIRVIKSLENVKGVGFKARDYWHMQLDNLI